MNKKEQTDTFLKELSNLDFGEYFQQFTALSKKQFLIRDLGLSARNYQQWKELEITPPTEKENTKDGKREWVKLDFVEFVWMKIVISLRNLGYPYADIKKTKEFLFKTSDLGNSINRTKSNPEIIKQLTDFYAKENLPDDIKAVLIEAINNPLIIEKITNQLSKRRSLLEAVIFEAIQNKNMEIGIGFFENGECLPFNWNLLVMFDKVITDVKQDDVLNGTIRKAHIYVSITKFIMDFITEEEKQKHELALVMLKEEEMILLRELRSKDYKNITINFDKGTKTKIIKTEREKQIKQSEVDNFIKQNFFAPNTKTTYTATNKGDLIINTIKIKKIN